MRKSTGKLQDEEDDPRKPGPAPGTTIEGRENQIISLAYDLVEERIRKKTATSQEVTHFLKMGSVQAQIEKDILIKQKELLDAKTEAIKSQKKVEELYSEAMKAFKTYSGQEEPDD
jgi:hypothetical protein